MHWSERLSVLMKLENVHVFVSLSGKTKQPSLLRNYWALVSIYWNLINACESTCLWKQNGCLFQWYERWRKFCKMNKETFHAIFCHFEQQPEGKVVFKSKFSHELGEMKENLKAWPLFTWISSTHKISSAFETKSNKCRGPVVIKIKMLILLV